MTFRIQQSTTGDDVVVLTISGDIAADRGAELQALLDAYAGRRLVLDLEDLTVVDRAGVLFLARSEGSGSILTNCPGYVREWIDREKERMRQGM